MRIDPETKIVSLDIRSQAFYNDPYPFYDQLRSQCPVFYWQEPGMWTFTRHADVSAILRDRRFGRQMPPSVSRDPSGECPVIASEPAWQKPFFDIDRLSMIGLEPPAHTRLRGLVQKAFVGRQIEAWRPRIESLCNDLIDQWSDEYLSDKGATDLLTHYATPIPVTIIAEMLGVPIEMAPELLRWSHDMVQMYEMQRTGEMERSAVSASQEFVAYLRDFVDHRRKRPQDDLISQLIAVEQGGQRLSEDELIANVILLLNAGHEATVHAIGNGVLALLRHPDQAERWRQTSTTNSSELDRTAVEEILRFDAPLHQFNRWVREPVQMHGQCFDVGQEVALLLGSANRDPDVFDAPHRLDLRRNPNPHVSLGGGIHYCLGASLARLEIQIAVPALLRRRPHLQLAENPVYRNNFHFHGLSSLMVSW